MKKMWWLALLFGMSVIAQASVTVTVNVSSLAGGTSPGAIIQVTMQNCVNPTIVNVGTPIPQTQNFYPSPSGVATITLYDNVTQVACNGNLLSYYSFNLISLGTTTFIKNVELPPGNFNLANLANVTLPPFSPGVIQGPPGVVFSTDIATILQTIPSCQAAGYTYAPETNTCVAGGGGIISFNTRTGAVTLLASDIQSALGTQTGCNTAGYVYSPQTNTCIASPSISAIQQNAYVTGTDIGTANTYSVVLTPAPTVVVGSGVLLRIANSSTGASTLTVNGTSTPIRKKTASGLVAIASGDLLAGSFYRFDYDGTYWQTSGSASSGGGTGSQYSPAYFSATNTIGGITPGAGVPVFSATAAPTLLPVAGTGAAVLTGPNGGINPFNLLEIGSDGATLIDAGVQGSQVVVKNASTTQIIGSGFGSTTGIFNEDNKFHTEGVKTPLLLSSGNTYSLQQDAAFQSAASTVLNNGGNTVMLETGAGVYNSCYPDTLPPAGFYTVDDKGQGMNATFINQVCDLRMPAVVTTTTTAPYTITATSGSFTNTAATAAATLTGTAVTSVVPTNTSTGYFSFSPPSVTWSGGGCTTPTGGTPLLITAGVVGNGITGGVTSYTINTNATTCTSAPTVAVAAPYNLLPSGTTVVLNNGTTKVLAVTSGAPTDATHLNLTASPGFASANTTFINQVDMVSRAATGGTAYQTWAGMTFNANNFTTGCMNLRNVDGGNLSEINCQQVDPRGDHFYQFGGSFDDHTSSHLWASSPFPQPALAVNVPAMTGTALTSVSCTTCGSYSAAGAGYVTVEVQDPHKYCSVLPTVSATLTSLGTMTATSDGITTTLTGVSGTTPAVGNFITLPNNYLNYGIIPWATKISSIAGIGSGTVVISRVIPAGTYNLTLGTGNQPIASYTVTNGGNCSAAPDIDVEFVTPMTAFKMSTSDGTVSDYQSQGFQVGMDLIYANTVVFHYHPVHDALGLICEVGCTVIHGEMDTAVNGILFNSTVPFTLVADNAYNAGGNASGLAGQIMYTMVPGANGSFLGMQGTNGAHIQGDAYQFAMTNTGVVQPCVGSWPLGVTVMGQDRYNYNGTAQPNDCSPYLAIMTPLKEGIGPSIPAASTIAPTYATQHITTSTTTINTITPPYGCTLVTLGCNLTLVLDVAAPLGSSGNISNGLTTVVGNYATLHYDPGTALWYGPGNGSAGSVTGSGTSGTGVAWTGTSALGNATQATTYPGATFTANLLRTAGTGDCWNGDTYFGRNLAGSVIVSTSCSSPTANGIFSAATMTASGKITGGSFLTGTNCSSSTSPAVCGSAAAGSVVIAAASTSVVVNTTAVTANSQIMVTFDASLGTKLGVTCNTTSSVPSVSARTAGTSFTLVTTAPTTNPACFSYTILN